MSAVTETQPVPSNLAQLGIWLSQGWGTALRRFPGLVLIALVADVPLALIRAASAGVDNGIASFLMGFPAIALITPLAKAAAMPGSALGMPLHRLELDIQMTRYSR